MVWSVLSGSALPVDTGPTTFTMPVVFIDHMTWA